MLSAGCLFWLQRLQPLFLTVAVVSLAYQAWLVIRRPATTRTWGMKAIFGASVVLNAVLIGGWIALSIRYR